MVLKQSLGLRRIYTYTTLNFFSCIRYEISHFNCLKIEVWKKVDCNKIGVMRFEILG